MRSNKSTTINMVWAEDSNSVIGVNNELPWHIPDDLKRFKVLTSNGVVVMGSNTWVSLPKRPLPGRRNIILSRRETMFEGAEVFHAIDEILILGGIVWVIGGGALYEQFLPFADKLYVTQVDTVINFSTTDTIVHAPSREKVNKEFKVLEESSQMVDEGSGVGYRFVTYEKLAS